MKLNGNQVRILRQQSKRTLSQLAKDADISSSFLSQIERGISEPSHDAALRIAGALNVPVQSISLTELKAEEKFGGVYKDRFVTPETAKTLQVLESQLEPGYQAREHAYAHPEDEEFIFVIEGILELRIGDDVHQISAGDSLMIDPRIPHSYANPSDAPVKWLWISAK